MKNRLEFLRNQKGWTQQELADQVEVSRQTIISLENGKYNPSILLAFRLARLFSQSIESIFIYEENNNHESV
jgi:putative transcriptional regulator